MLTYLYTALYEYVYEWVHFVPVLEINFFYK